MNVALARLVIEALEQLYAAGDVHQRLPAQGQALGQVHEQVAVLGNQVRCAVGAFQIPAQPVAAFCCARKGMAAHSRSTTQVSLLPPPWDEFTTIDPLRMATRVRPPVVT